MSALAVTVWFFVMLADGGRGQVAVFQTRPECLESQAGLVAAQVNGQIPPSVMIGICSPHPAVTVPPKDEG